MQWGYKPNLTAVQSSISFPIVFTTVYGIGAVCIYTGTATSGVSRSHTVKGLSTTGFTFAYPDASERFGCSYIVSGVQQWGETPAQDNGTTVLPISFTSLEYRVAFATKSLSGAYGNRIAEKSLASFKTTRISSVSVSSEFIAIGY